MSSLNRLQENWEGFAKADPLWAICTDSRRRGNKWTKEEFFETGQTEIGRVMEYLRLLGLVPDTTSAALDFGCGVGRLTRALAQYFPECWGVDISPTMIRLARDFNQVHNCCHFWLNEKDDLRSFPDETFAFIYTSIVLQHIESQYVERYLLELIRVLKTGGIFVFQLLERDNAPWIARLRNRIGVRRRIPGLRRRKNLEALPMAMHCIPEKDIREWLAGRPVRIAAVVLTNSGASSFNGNLQFLDEEPKQGFVSKQYCLVKTGPAASGANSRQEQGGEAF